MTALLVAVGLSASGFVARALRGRPQYGVLALAALAPYDGLLLVVPHPSAVGLWKEGLVVLTVVAAWLARRARPDRIAPWVLPAVALVALGLGSLVVEPTIRTLFGFKVGYFYLLVPLALWWAPLDRRDRDRIVSILMVNGVVVSIVGIVQQALGPETLNDLGYEYNEVIRFAGGYMRSFSTFNQPFPFAFFVMVVLLVCVPVALDELSRRRNQLFLAAVPLLLVGMATSVVRGAVFGMVIGAVYLAVARYRVLGHAVVLAPLALVALVWIGGLGAFTSSSSLDERTGGWVTEVIDGRVEPFGTGLGTVGSAAARATVLENGDAALDSPGTDYQPDNYYVKTLIELGPLGLWLLVTLVAAAATHATTMAWRVPPADRGLALGIGGGTVGAIAAAVVSAYWEIYPVDLYFWMLLGVLSSIALDSSSTPSPSGPTGVASRPTAGS